MDSNVQNTRRRRYPRSRFRHALRHCRMAARSSVRTLVILWLCTTSCLVNCTASADQPTFLGLPYCPSCQSRYGVCPSVAHCVPLRTPPMPNSQLITDPTSAERWLLTTHDAVEIALSNSQAVRNLG